MTWPRTIISRIIFFEKDKSLCGYKTFLVLLCREGCTSLPRRMHEADGCSLCRSHCNFARPSLLRYIRESVVAYDCTGLSWARMSYSLITGSCQTDGCSSCSRCTTVCNFLYFWTRVLPSQKMLSCTDVPW